MRHEVVLQRGKASVVIYTDKKRFTIREFGLNYAARNGFLKGQGTRKDKQK